MSQRAKVKTENASIKEIPKLGGKSELEKEYGNMDINEKEVEEMLEIYKT